MYIQDPLLQRIATHRIILYILCIVSIFATLVVNAYILLEMWLVQMIILLIGIYSEKFTIFRLRVIKMTTNLFQY